MYFYKMLITYRLLLVSIAWSLFIWLTVHACTRCNEELLLRRPTFKLVIMCIFASTWSHCIDLSRSTNCKVRKIIMWGLSFFWRLSQLALDIVIYIILLNVEQKYDLFCVSFSFIFLSASLFCNIYKKINAYMIAFT